MNVLPSILYGFCYGCLISADSDDDPHRQGYNWEFRDVSNILCAGYHKNNIVVISVTG